MLLWLHLLAALPELLSGRQKYARQMNDAESNGLLDSATCMDGQGSVVVHESCAHHRVCSTARTTFYKHAMMSVLLLCTMQFQIRKINAARP